MRYLNILWRVEIAAIVALVICASLMAAYGWLHSTSYEASLLDPWDSAWLLFAYTGTLGILPAAAVGAPIYALCIYRNWQSWLVAALIGALPGAVGYIIEGQFNISRWLMICGVFVALLTHVIVRYSPSLQRIHAG